MKRIKTKWWMVALIIFSLVFRLSLTNMAMHDDVVVQAGWGHWIFENKSMRGFYENRQWIYGWPNQPPVISYLYSVGFKIHEGLNTTMVGLGNFIALNRLGASHIPWYYKFVSWFSADKFENTPYYNGQLISLKLIPIFGDLILAGLLFWIVKKYSNEKKALIISAIFLLSPFSWYESALWGQHDQMSLIFVLLAFLAVSNRWIILAPLLWAISIWLKSTGLIFAPLLVWCALRNRESFKKFLIGSIATLGIYFVLVTVISPNNFVVFNLNLVKQMFAKGDFATWVNAFNFWRLVTPEHTDSRNLFLGISYSIWGYVMFGIINILAFWQGRKRDFWSIVRALFVISFGGWLLMSTMHERYLFTAIGSGLLLTVRYPKTMKWWLAMSLVFWINMYFAWWRPMEWEWIRNVLIGQNESLIAKCLSALMIIIFAVMVKRLKGEGEKVEKKN